MKVWLTNQSLLRMFYLRHQWVWRDRVRKLDQHQQRGIQPVPQSTKRLLIQWQDGWQSRSMKGRTLVYILKPRTPPTRVPVKTARRVWKGIRYSHRERYAMSFEVINESGSTNQPGKWVRILKKQVKLLETRTAGCVFLYGVGMEIFQCFTSHKLIVCRQLDCRCYRATS